MKHVSCHSSLKIKLESVVLNCIYSDSYTGEIGMLYRIPSEIVAVGLLVAAIYPEDDNWHRCVITGMGPGNYVEVGHITTYRGNYVEIKWPVIFLRHKYS